MDIEKIIFDEKIKKLVKENDEYKYILKSDIDALNLDDNERNYFYRILFKNKIKICINKDGKLLNYNEIFNNKLPNNIPYLEQKKMFEMMHSEDCPLDLRKKLRKELIETNIRLVGYVSYKYAMDYDIDIDELNSYGYEGLIISVDTFDEKLGNAFSTYAITNINNAILKGISYMLGFRHQNYLFLDFIKIKREVEIKTNRSLKDDPMLVYSIVDEMKKRNIVKNGVGDRLLINLLINYVSICECNDFNYYDSSDIVFNHDLLGVINEVIDRLNEKEKKVLALRYGFYDGNCNTLDAIGKKMNLSGGRIYSLEKEIIRKIKRTSSFVKLKKYYKDL